MLLQRITCFLEVASCLSFSTAAQNLHITQQAVTKQIATLEKELGLSLFYRTTRQVVLTPAGSILRDDFSQLRRQMDASIRRAQALDASGRPLLRVGFLSALSRRDIILPITEFIRAQNPDTELDIKLLDFIEIRNQLLDGRLDFCVTTSNDWQLWPSTDTTVLKRKQFQVVASRLHPLSSEQSLQLAHLANYTQLTLPDDNLMAGVMQWGKRIPCSSVVHCPDIGTLMVRLDLGEGFALLTKVIEGHDAPELCYWDVPFPEAHAELVCICRENEREEIREIIRSIRKQELIHI